MPVVGRRLLLFNICCFPRANVITFSEDIAAGLTAQTGGDFAVVKD
jgi:hypothetical protein